MEENVKIEEFAGSNEMNEVLLKIKNMRGVKKEFGTYTAEVTDDYSVKVSSFDGVEAVYPAMSSSWSVLMSWMIRWDDDAILSITNFFDYIAMPVMTNISNIDDRYINDIVRAQISLKDRNKESGVVDDEKDDAYYMSRDVFVKLMKE